VKRIGPVRRGARNASMMGAQRAFSNPATPIARAVFRDATATRASARATRGAKKAAFAGPLVLAARGRRRRAP
jgi:hypothetical protein